MNERSDIDRVLRHWFEDGPTTMPDRVVDVVAHRISVRPQRRSWRLLGRFSMSPLFKYGAAAAAVLIVAVVGYNLLPKQTGVGTPTTQPTAAPSPAATVVPTPTAVGIRDVPAEGAPLAPGPWRFHVASESSAISIVADMPAGWSGGSLGIENIAATNSLPRGIAVRFEMPAHGVFSDPCHWDRNGNGTLDEDGDVAIGSTIADLVTALRANASFTSSAPAPVAFGTYSGQRLELRLPTDLEPSTCDRDPTDDSGTYRIMPDTIYSQGKANIWEMSIVDVAGTRLVLIIEYFPGTDPAKLAEARAIVNSFVITP
jgi:hypothetical protein